MIELYQILYLLPVAVESVLLCRRCDTLCTSDFTDDIIVMPLSTTLCLRELPNVAVSLPATYEPLAGPLLTCSLAAQMAQNT